ncbi:MAG: S-layer homology domain-containing protein [Bacillota bacterium]|nr:S-layer homology domain-containing protein [Bacillota bacterium]
MKRTKRFLGILLVVCMCLAMASMGVLGDTNQLSGKTVVVYTGNLRGDVDMLPKVAQVEANYEAQGADVIIVDTGNFLQGSVYATYDSGKTLVNLMVAAGYDGVAIGSHEFDFGTGKVGVEQHEVYYQDDTLGKILSDAGLPATSANIMTKAADNSDINAYNGYVEIATASGTKIGFIGLTDPNTVNQVLETNLTGLSFLSDNDLLTAAANQAASAKNSGSVAVIALGNTGSVTSINGVSSVVDTPSNAGLTAGAIIINNSTGAIESSQSIELSSINDDAAVKSEVDTAKAAIDAEYPSQNIVSNDYTLNGSQTDVRSQETNLGDLWCDALLWFAKEGGITSYYTDDAKNSGNTNIKVDSDHIVALWNGGNLRDYLNTGDVTLKDIQRVLPYPNRVAVVYLTGSELLEQLEACSQGLPCSDDTFSQCASFMQVAGINYTVDAYKTYDRGDAYELHNTWYKAKSIQRVTINNVNGKAFDPNATYAVITNNANYNGMDASYVMLEKKDADISTITSADVRNVVLMYIQNKLNGQIGQKYMVPQGRITVNTAAPNSAYSDVAPNSWYQPYISQVTALGLMIGVGDNEFAPNDTSTRAMMVTVLYRMAGNPKTTASIPYTDVPANTWYSEAVAWATEQGVVNGTSTTTFSPLENITRQQMVTMFYRYAGTMGRDITARANLASFTGSSSISAYAVEAFQWAVATGIINGITPTTLAPADTGTRGQMAKVIVTYRNTAY